MTECRLGLVALALLACACGGASGSDDELGNDTESSSTDSGSTDSGSTDDSTDDTTDDTETETQTETGEDPRPDRLVVTADWKAKRLSLLDYAAIRDGATTRDEALWREVDLSAWEPGPLELALTPDGARALVSISPGFFTGLVGNLIGAGSVAPGGTLILIELDTGELVHEFATAQTPMHPVISADGLSAWTANYGGDGPRDVGTTVSKLDLVTGSVEFEFVVGPRPEQIDLSADESLAIVSTAGDGAIQLFATADPEATLSADLVTSADSSWVLLLDDGSERAFVTNSLEPSSYSVVDIADPALPALIETITVTGVPYAATPMADGRRMLMTTIDVAAEAIHLYEIDLGEPGQLSSIMRDLVLPAGGFPMGIAYAPEDALVFVPAPGHNALVVVDLDDESTRSIPWQDVTGPSFVVIEP
jgi:hypothetical protein